MTINNAVRLADELWPNAYPASVKVAWLSELDGRVFAELVSRHEGAPESFAPYTDQQQDRELLIPYPFAQEVYVCFLRARIDRENGETDSYNRSAEHFNEAMQSFADYYNRTHLPLSAGAMRF